MSRINLLFCNKRLKGQLRLDWYYWTHLHLIRGYSISSCTLPFVEFKSYISFMLSLHIYVLILLSVAKSMDGFKELYIIVSTLACQVLTGGIKAHCYFLICYSVVLMCQMVYIHCTHRNRMVSENVRFDTGFRILYHCILHAFDY